MRTLLQPPDSVWSVNRQLPSARFEEQLIILLLTQLNKTHAFQISRE